MTKNSGVRRFKKDFPCPICGGYEQAPRGKGVRCYGFLSGDRVWAHCTRDEYAGALPQNECSGTYAHKVTGDCGCGVRHNPNPARRKQVVRETVYPITDANGVILAEHVRVDYGDGAKTFIWRRNGRPGLDGLRVEDLPLFNLPDLPAVPPDAPVALAEGEKTAAALKQWGVLALGTITGAGATPSVATLRPLLGHPVLLWPDNNEVGRDHMSRIARRLWGMGHRNLRIVDWAEAPPGGDAADFQGDDAALRALLDAAKRYEPPASVDLGALLDNLRAFVRTYVVVGNCELDALSLWVAHTWALDAAETTPYVHVTSPEKRSGKTRLLETLAMLVARPWLTGRVTAAVLVRKVASQCPTLLLDESDAVFRGEKEYAEALRAILNAGHRRGGVASLCVKAGGDFELRDFPVFGPKAIAGIGKLPDTVADRAIRIGLKRRAPSEPVARFRQREARALATPLRERLGQWAAGAVQSLADARPGIPSELDDRAADGWEPLLAIADAAGGPWPGRARQAALALSVGDGREDESLGARLLRDIKGLFEERRADRLASAELVQALTGLEEAPWGDFHGKPLDTRILARLLRPYGVRPKTIRLGEDTPKGYLAENFADAWERYVSPAQPPQPPQPPQTPASKLANVADVADVADPGGVCAHQKLDGIPPAALFPWDEEEVHATERAAH